MSLSRKIADITEQGISGANSLKTFKNVSGLQNFDSQDFLRLF